MSDFDLSLFQSELKSEEPYRRYEAIILLGECRHFFSVEPTIDIARIIFPYLNDPHDHVRYYSIIALEVLGFKEAIPYLKQRYEIEKDIFVERPKDKHFYYLKDVKKKLLEAIDYLSSINLDHTSSSNADTSVSDILQKAIENSDGIAGDDQPV